MDQSFKDRIVAAVLQRLPSLVALYVFGSRADGRAQADSDLDLAVLPAQPLGSARLWELRDELALVLGLDVDLIDLSRVSTVLQNEVVQHGKLVHQADRSRTLLFEARVLKDYARLLEDTAEIRRDIARRGKVYA